MAVAQSTVVTGRWQRQTWAEERWPRTAGARWLLRLALALPFAGLALFASGFDAGTQALPPLPALVASLVPGGAIGVSLATCLATGIMLAALGERLIRWEVPVRIGVPLLVPALAFAGSQDLTGILTVAFLALALEAFVQFAVAGQTEGAFHAGLLLAGAVLCAPVAVVFALALGVAAPFVAAERGRAEPATWVVLSFPALAALAGWTFLDWIFTGFGDLGLDPAIAAGLRGRVAGGRAHPALRGGGGPLRGTPPARSGRLPGAGARRVRGPAGRAAVVAGHRVPAADLRRPGRGAAVAEPPAGDVPRRGGAGCSGRWPCRGRRPARPTRSGYGWSGVSERPRRNQRRFLPSVAAGCWRAASGASRRAARVVRGGPRRVVRGGSRGVRGLQRPRRQSVTIASASTRLIGRNGCDGWIW